MGRGQEAAKWGSGVKVWKPCRSHPKGISAHGAMTLGRRNSETEVGDTRSHRDTRKSIYTRLRAHVHTRTHASSVHTRTLHSPRLWPTGRGRGQQSQTAAGAQRSLPAAPLTGLAQQAAARAGAGRALPELSQARQLEREERRGGGRGQGVCPRSQRGLGGVGRGEPRGRGRAAYKVSLLPGINKPRLARLPG